MSAARSISSTPCWEPSAPKAGCPWPIHPGMWDGRDSRSWPTFSQTQREVPTARDGGTPISTPARPSHLAFQAMETEDPYPVKAYIAYRHDPLMGFPDPDALKRFSKARFACLGDLQLVGYGLVFGCRSPLSPYLERESIMAGKNGLKPHFFVRQRAVDAPLRHQGGLGDSLRAGQAAGPGTAGLRFH